MFYASEKYDSALVYFKKAEKYTLLLPNIESTLSLYQGFTKTYTALNDIKKAYPYMILLRKEQNISDSLFHRARYMNIYAEYNYSNYLEKIKDYKKTNLF